MSEFLIYLGLGFEHISDLNGYDHMIFLLALAAGYRLADWRRVLVLVTAFTLGHSLTLALSTLNWIHPPSHWIEFLIPVTILCTAVLNLFQAFKRKDWEQNPHSAGYYVLALGFGLIHGMGFSNYLKAILGQEESIFQPLLAFNLGLEAGQILIILVILGLNFISLRWLSLTQKTWMMGTSVLALVIALVLCFRTFPL
ncbi:MAG: HupE/UreJ family protein [Bacteroidia bacterium]|nr:HupE/UreJ family protein [Bacteroidia bacterium]